MKRNAQGHFVKGTHWRTPQPFRRAEWLRDHYVKQKLSAGDIADMFGVTDAAILFWLRRHRIPRRTVSEARRVKRWGAVGVDNPMWNRKGDINPNWKGGVTADRQAFYTGAAWKSACAAVWHRDGATCRRCGLHRDDSPDMPFHIHHVVGFANKKLRANPNNLVLVCEACHHFIHSKRNLNREFLPKK